MRAVFDPGRERRSINFIDHIVYSHVQDRNGNPVDLDLSLMVQNGNSEMRLAAGRDDEAPFGKQPLVIWLNGAGWHDVDKNIMTAEMQFLAEARFAVAFIHYRGTELAGWPAQLIDCKTAVRFLRAHADKYNLDTSRIGVIGRSAGGHLAAWMAMNTEGFDTEEWADQSSRVEAAVDMFGPTDLPLCFAQDQHMIDTIPNYRWKNISEGHAGKLIGGDMETMVERSKAASPDNFINDGMCPIMILHGDLDPLVPLSISEHFYEKLTEAGLEDRTEFYVIKNGGHGSREFFQFSTRRLIVDFFDRKLRKGE